MQRPRENFFDRNAKANEVLAFIKADPNFTTNKQKMWETDPNKNITLLMLVPNEAYTINVFQRIIRSGTSPMCGTQFFVREEKVWQMQIDVHGKVVVFDDKGTMSAKQLSDFTFSHQARRLIAKLKEDKFYQCETSTFCNKAVFSRLTQQPTDMKARVGKVSLEIYPDVGFWYQLTYGDPAKPDPSYSCQHDLNGCHDKEIIAYHEQIAPLLDDLMPKEAGSKLTNSM